MRVYLSIVLDSLGLIKKDLIEFDDLVKLDFYTVMLEDSNSIRDIFKKDINIYLKENINYLKRYKNNYHGRICITYYDKQGNVRFFPILYKKDIEFLKRKDNLERISLAFSFDYILEEVFERKKYLLTKSERELLGLYLENKKLEVKNTFINTFVNRIACDKNSYLYVRSLLNVCNLLKQNDDYYQIEMVEFNKIKKRDKK